MGRGGDGDGEEAPQVVADRMAALEKSSRLTIRKLHTLSKAQTALLRLALVNKMRQRDMLLSEVLGQLRRHEDHARRALENGGGGIDAILIGSEDVERQLQHFTQQTVELSMSDATVEDHIAAEHMALREENEALLYELDVLRRQVKKKDAAAASDSNLKGSVGGAANSGSTSVAITSSTLSEKDKEKMRRLYRQNEKLKKMVKEFQEAVIKGEIQDLSTPAAASGKFLPSAAASEDGETHPPTPKDTTSALEATMTTKDKEITELKEQIKTLQTELEAAKLISANASPPPPPPSEETVADASGNLTRHPSASEMAALNAALEIAKAKADRYKKAKKDLEKERDDLIQTALEEVNKVEVAKKAEIKELKKEIKRLTRSSTGNKAAMEKMVQQITASRSAMLKLKSDVKAELAKAPAIARETTVAITGRLSALDRELKEVKGSYARECRERKRLFNLVQELRGNIRVFCRCRPPTQKELDGDGSSIAVSFPAEGEIECVNDRNRKKSWEFDKVFDLETSQEDVYTEVSPLVTSVLDGYNVCIFAFGQTGTGKTYTMNGPRENRGVNSRALEELFNNSRLRRAEMHDQIEVSILEIYNESIRDLLSENVGDRKLEVRQGEFGMYVPELTLVPVSTLDEVFQLLKLSEEHRSSACTNMNEHSSRSHMILSVYIMSTNLTTGVVSRGKLHLIDLAGSERISKSGATGLALKEAQNINKSLSALGDVIAARANKQGHVPYRNSTLTYLLQDSLSSDSKTLMFVCVSPVMYNAEENFCSLNFASRVRAVELGKAAKHVTNGPGSGDNNSASISPKSSPLSATGPAVLTRSDRPIGRKKL